MAPGPGTVLVGSDEWHLRRPRRCSQAVSRGACEGRKAPWDEHHGRAVGPSGAPAGGTTIKTEQDDAQLGATISTLSNGIRVIAKRLCCKDGGADVKITGWRPVGRSSAPDARFAIDAAVGLGFPGPTPLWSPMCCSFNYAHVVEATRVSLEAEIPHDKLEIMFQKIYVDFTGVPKPDAKELAAWQQERRTELVFQVNLDEHAMELAGAQLGHEPAITAAMVDALDLDRVLAARRALFEDFTGATFTLVGRFDLAQGKELAEVYLGGLPTGPSASRRRGTRCSRAARGVANAVFPPPTDFYCFQWLASKPASHRPGRRSGGCVHKPSSSCSIAGSRARIPSITTHAYLDPITHTRELRFVAGCSHPYGFDARTIARITKAARARSSARCSTRPCSPRSATPCPTDQTDLYQTSTSASWPRTAMAGAPRT